MNKDLKVLHLSSEKTWRGGEQQIAYLIETLNEMGVQNFIAVRTGSAFERHCIRMHWEYISLPFSNSIDLPTALKIKQFSQQQNVDFIHMHSSKSHGIAVLSSLLGNKTPLILSRRVDFVPKNSWFTHFKYDHPQIKRIVCVSDKINEVISHYEKNSDRNVTVHSGVDLEKFKGANRKINLLRKEFSIDSSYKLVGNTSALAPHKDYITFINTIKILVSKNALVKGIIIGEGSLEGTLKSYVEEHGLTDSIIFTGFRKDIIDVLPSLDVFLITSEEEGLGTSVLDAFLAGVPVVATRAGGLPEMVIDETTGLLAEVRDAETLSQQVCRILSDNSLRKQLVDKASDFVKRFSKEETARKTLEIYQQVLREDQH